MGNYVDTFSYGSNYHSEAALEAGIGTPMTSEAEAAALYIPQSEKAAAGGVAPLDTQAIIPAINVAALRPNGVVRGDLLTWSVDTATRTITYSCASPLVIYNIGMKVPAPLSGVTAAFTDTTKLWLFVYKPGFGFHTTRIDQFNLTLDTILGAFLYVSTADGGPRVVEMHTPFTPGWTDSHREHSLQREGTYLVTGAELTGYTEGAHGDTNTSFDISATTITGQGLETVLASLAQLGPYSSWFRFGASAANIWKWDQTPSVPFLVNGSRNPLYNQNLAGTFKLTAISSDNTWWNVWMLALPANASSPAMELHRYPFILGQQTYSSLREACDAQLWTEIDFGGDQVFLQAKPLYRLTYRRVAHGAEKQAQLVQVTSLGRQSLAYDTYDNPPDHAGQEGLDYESAQHTGFARQAIPLAGAPDVNYDQINSAGAVDADGNPIKGFRAGDTVVDTTQHNQAHDLMDGTTGAAIWIPRHSLEFGSPVHIGRFNSVAEAIAYAQSKKIDQNGDGTGWLQPGQRFWHLVQGQEYYVDQWGVWGTAKTYDPGLDQLKWTDWGLNGSITPGPGYVTLAGSAASGCTWPAGGPGFNMPYKTMALPPVPFFAVVRISTQLAAIASGKFVGLAVIYGTDTTKHYRSEIVCTGGAWQQRRVLHDVAGGLRAGVGGNPENGWIAISWGFDPGGNPWTASVGEDHAAPPNNQTIWGNPVMRDAEQADLVWERGIEFGLYAGHDDTEPAFEVRASDFTLWRL